MTVRLFQTTKSDIFRTIFKTVNDSLRFFFLVFFSYFHTRRDNNDNYSSIINRTKRRAGIARRVFFETRMLASPAPPPQPRLPSPGSASCVILRVVSGEIAVIRRYISRTIYIHKRGLVIDETFRIEDATSLSQLICWRLARRSRETNNLCARRRVHDVRAAKPNSARRTAVGENEWKSVIQPPPLYCNLKKVWRPTAPKSAVHYYYDKT